MNDNLRKDIARRILALRGVYSKNPTFTQLDNLFQDVLADRMAAIEQGVQREARGIALIGASGCGKTAAIDRLEALQPELTCPDPVTGQLTMVRLIVPSPATLKFVGHATLKAVGLTLMRDKPAHMIWDMVRTHLHARRTLFLHYDEAQALSLHQSPRELASVVETLKSLVQDRTWPTNLILTGTPLLKEIINHDPQLARRIYPLEFVRLNTLTDQAKVVKIICAYAGRAKVEVAPELLAGDFPARAIHAADRQFGLLVGQCISAIGEAMAGEGNQLSIANFAAMYRKQAFCVDGLNPFIADDFERIDTRKLLNPEEDDDDT